MSKKSYKTRKRILGLIVGFCLLITGFTPTTIMAYSAHTQSEAVAWAQSQLGKALDYDGKYGAQCVDLICYYYQYLGTTSPGGNAEEYRRNNLPSGWTRVYENYQPGDIAVWKPSYRYGSYSTTENGHVGIVTSADINVNFYNLHFYNGCAVSGARESYGDQLYGIYEIDEAGNYQNTGITDFITENKILNPDDFEFVYADGKQAVYIYDGEEFYIYNVATAEVYDIYNPDYADKFWHGWTDTLKVSICGEKYLVLLNMEGTDGQNYYAVMDFYGSMITEATKCDLAIATEKGNIVVKNGDGLNEIELAKLETPEEQSLNLMPLLETNRSWRNEQTAGMDIQGNTYGNAIEYSFVTNPFGTEEYSTCDAWYLGGNYSRLTGTWYFPADQIQDGFAHIRLIGDGNVIYDNSELNADNCQIDFDIDVSGIRELSFEYNGICDMTDILFGMSDAKLYS